MTNLEIAKLLRRMAAAYEILGENKFRIIAYDRAADSIEHITRQLKDYWLDHKLQEIPGVGDTLASHLDELFRTGHSKYFDSVFGKLPASVFPLLLVPGIGPKKAYKLVRILKLTNEKKVIEELENAAVAHKIAKIEGFGDKSEADILANIKLYRKGQIKENRMTLSVADGIAQNIIAFMKQSPIVGRVDVLGSLRRQASTIGDIDIAIVTNKPKESISHFLTYPHEEIIEKGPSGASIRLHNGRQVDLRVAKPEFYGSMLQYFTGGKNHNIALRSFALSKGLSLSEYGIKHVSNGKVDQFSLEEDFYKAIGLDYISPELREDRGEIEASYRGDLPHLVELKDVRGDLHIHTNYNLEPSHDVGVNPFSDYLDKAAELSYQYIGVSDHNPSIANHSEKQIIEIMKKRKQSYEDIYTSWQKKSKKSIHYYLMCEVDIMPDGKLALPDAAFEYVDAVIVSIHSSFTQERKIITKRIISALVSNSKVRIFGHPTGRLLGYRDGVDADWQAVFDVCKARDIALEINAGPQRLDLPDELAHDALKKKLRFCLGSDAHESEAMNFMRYGVSVARRAWITKHDIVNCLGYNDFRTWLMKGV